MLRKLANSQADNGLAAFDDTLARLGQAANQVAASIVFADYRARKAPNTLRRQDADLALFAEYLGDKGASVGDLAQDAQAWRGVSWGLVAGFLRWQLARGYAVGSANIRLSTLKTYTKLALKAGAIEPEAYGVIKAVEGYSHSERRRIDDQRAAAGVDTRKGAKKALPVGLTPEQARGLKKQPDTPQGRRDALLMSLLLDHGLRVGEVAILTVENFDLQAGELRFFRPKVDMVQTHRLSRDALRAAQDYLAQDAPASGPVWRRSLKSGELAEVGMSDRAITKRVCELGAEVGAIGLSAHDCRHFWATLAARKKTDPFSLRDAGGWKSLAMPSRYIEAAKIANEGVNLE